ncbi:MAG: hypothetical protein WDO56_06175 [Gammaproteobacteria bacterium]
MAGSSNPRDFVTIVLKSANEGTYKSYIYVEKGGALKLVMPPVAGDYELRLLGANSPYPTRVKRPIKLEAVSATLDFPAQVAGGSKFRSRGPARRMRATSSASATPRRSTGRIAM